MVGTSSRQVRLVAAGASTGPGEKLVNGSIRFALLAAAGALLVFAAASPASATTVMPAQPVPGTNSFYDVACSTPTTCVAVGYGPGGSVLVPLTKGTPGAAQVVPVRSLVDVACASATTCYAVGSQNGPPIPPSRRPSLQGSVVTITNGAAGSPVAIPAVQSLNDIACPTATTCYALGAARGGANVVVTLTNGVPGAIQPISGPYDLSTLACSSATTCYAVGSIDDQGVVVPITNGVPGAPQLVPGTQSLYGIACPTASTCSAVGVADDFFSPVLVPIVNGIPGALQIVPDVAALTAIACPSATTCEAVGFQNTATDSTAVVVPIVNGVAGTPVVVPGANGFYGVACASAATCVAVGSDTTAQGVVAIIHEPPTDANACKGGGWKLFSTPAFKNQGQCVSYVMAGPRVLPPR